MCTPCLLIIIFWNIWCFKCHLRLREAQQMTQYHTAGNKARILTPSLCNAKTTLSPSHHMVSLKGRSVFQPCGLPTSSTISSCKLGPCFPPLLTATESSLHNAGWMTASEDPGMCQGFRVSSLLQWRAQDPQSQAGQPDFPHGLRVCTYKYQPPTDNPLRKLQRSPPQPAWCLGFYHIYILQCSSGPCQWCTLKAFPSLTAGLAAFTGQALKGILLWPGTPDFLLRIQIWGTRCQRGLLTDIQVGNENWTSKQAIMVQTLKINMGLLTISNSHLW